MESFKHGELSDFVQWYDEDVNIINASDGGMIYAEGRNVVCKTAGNCLREAYLDAMENFFPFEEKELPEIFFRSAQYNTWMEYTYNPTQESVLAYAHAILENGYEPGILMIDEGWHISYGLWEFDFNKFPDPKAMIDELHSLGFKVMLWIVPYVTLDGRNFLDHYYPWASERAGKVFEPRLARQANGKIAVVEWWNGFSALLDLTEENDKKYLDHRLRYLMETYGIDGFKFDGGNIVSLRQSKWLTEPPVKSSEALNKAWNDLAHVINITNTKIRMTEVVERRCKESGIVNMRGRETGWIR